MAHPMILAMSRAIELIEENFARQHGLASPKLVKEIKQTLQSPVHDVREAMAAEPKALPRWKRKPNSFVTLPNGEVVHYGPKQTKTTYMRRNYNAGDVDLLARIVEAQPKKFTFEDTMRLKSRRKIDAQQIARVRKSI